METYDYYLKALNRHNKSKEIWHQLRENMSSSCDRESC